MTALSVAEQIELTQLEHRIQDGFNQIELKIKELWQAFAAVREKRLYRATHPTFEAYCRDRWEKGRSYINKIIAAGETIANLEASLGTAVPMPQTEYEVRPIASLPAEQQPQAWEAATTIAPNRKPDSTHTTRAAAAVKAKPAQSPSTGQKVTVLDESSDHYGKTVEVVTTQQNGVIVECKVEGEAKPLPFLRNEISNEAHTPKPERIQQAPQPKVNHLAGMQSELDVERLRVDLLERELTRLIEAIEAEQSLESLKNLAAEVKKLIL